MNNIMTFKRREIKYLLDDDEYNSLKERLQARLVEDEHGTFIMILPISGL